MPCFRPLKAYRAPGGGVVFDSKAGYSDRHLELACGQCKGCKLRRAQDWAVRCVHESQMHEQSCFVTLTYDEEHLPSDGSLHPEHFRLFMRRLRRQVPKVRYFHCGEYGEQTLRPHYHALLFGVDFHADRALLRDRPSGRLYRSPRLEELWGHGFAPLGAVTMESAAYVAGYVMKKQSGEQAEVAYARPGPDGELVSVKRPYVTMSRKPGLGSAWFERFRGDVFPSDQVIIGGKSYPVPRFYLELMDEDEQVEVKRRRRASLQAHREDLTPERLRVRERVAEHRLMRSAREAV